MPEIAGSTDAHAHAQQVRALGGWLVVWVALLGVIFAVGAGPRVLAAPAPGCAGARALSSICLVARYETLTHTSGAQAALADMVERRKPNGYLDLAYHQLTHVIGRTAIQRLGAAMSARGSLAARSSGSTRKRRSRPTAPVAPSAGT